VSYDIAIVGGGIMGAASALALAESGMRPLLLESAELGQGASGVNAGTLSLQSNRVKLIPYALRGLGEWQRMGEAVGYRRTGGFTLAFSEREAELLRTRMELKRAAGAPIHIVSPAALAGREPLLSRKVVLASYCPQDGYANAALTGAYYRERLREAQIPCFEQHPVTRVEHTGRSFAIQAGPAAFLASRLLLACGAGLQPAAALLGVELPVHVRVNTVSVSEPCPPLLRSVIGHASGRLSLKQKPNGTLLIGGGWPGQGSPAEGRGQVCMETLIPNLQLAQFALPALAQTRIIRSWTGFEAAVPDAYPLAGALPGVPEAFVLGCVRGGFTIGPYLAKLMSAFIQGKEPELPLFDPARSFSEEPAPASEPPASDDPAACASAQAVAPSPA
jgi:sarcosine oxidase, subunit beta